MKAMTQNKSTSRKIFVGSFIFLVLLASGLFSKIYAAIPAIEREALIALYNSTDGDNWDDNSGWKTPPLHTDGFALPGKENTWHGVRCNSGNTTVERLELQSNQLNGSIPPQLGDLTNLQVLALYLNQLTGSIPPELGDLTNLQYLHLQSNQLSGSIPPQLGGLLNLQVLTMHSNQLTGSIPPELGNLTSLRYLLLERNQLSGNIPEDLGDLSNLKWLFLNSNMLDGKIPSNLANLTNLNYAAIGYNALYTDDNALRLFLDNVDPDWEET
jgi:Leucine-rich repeat (LRR) protein